LKPEACDRRDGAVFFEEGKLKAFGLLDFDTVGELFGKQHRTKLMHYGEAAIDFFFGSGDLNGSHESMASYQSCLARRCVMWATWWRECQA
jgi:hypothetical protein